MSGAANGRRAWTWRHAVAESGLKATSKHVLFTLSLFMDDLGDGCFPSIRELVPLSSLTETTLCQHLKIAEDEGWIERRLKERAGRDWARTQYLPKWPDGPQNRGAVQDAARGTQGNGVPHGQAVESPEKPESDQGVAGAPAGPPRGTQGNGVPHFKGAQGNGVPHIVSVPRESTPPDPPHGGGPGSLERVGDSEPDGSAPAVTLEDFKAAYPRKSGQPEKLADLWGILTGRQRGEACTGAQGYAVHCQRHKFKPKDPVNFLRQPALWAEMAPLAPRPPPGAVFVERGGRAFAALCVLRAVLHGPDAWMPPPDPAGRDGALVGETADLAAMDSLAEFAGEAGTPDFGGWRVCEEGTRQWWAWGQRVARCGFGPLGADMVEIPGERDQLRMPDGRTFDAPRRVNGRLVPCEWPPKLTLGGGGRQDGAKAGGDGETGNERSEAAE
jgi:hypothetical protein